MTLSGTITAAALNAEFDAGRTALNTSAALVGADNGVRLQVNGLTSSTDLRDRSMYFKVATVAEVLALRGLTTSHASATVTTTYTLECVLQDGADATLDPEGFGLRDPVTVSSTLSDSTETPSLVAPTRRLFLVPGRLYRLKIESDSASASLRAIAMLIKVSKRGVK